MALTRAKSSLSVPEGSWDTHMHVADPVRFPVSAKAVYKPHAAHLKDAHANAKRLGVPNLVFVQPSTYGFDNACLLEALGQVGTDHGRGVVVCDPDATTPEQLQSWHAQGVRGVRVNLVSVKSEMSTQELSNLLQKYANLIGSMHSWSIQVYVNLAVLPQLEPIVERLKVKFVIDHMGNPPEARQDMKSLPGWESLLRMLQMKHVFVKVTGPYRISKDAEFRDLEPAVRDLLRVRNGESVVWASDWPHTRFEHIDVGPWVTRCLEWCDNDVGLCQKLFRTNAEALLDVQK